MEQQCGCASSHLLQHRGCMDCTGLPSPSHPHPKAAILAYSHPTAAIPAHPYLTAAGPAHPHPMTAILVHSYLTAAISACPHPTAPIPALPHPNTSYPSQHCCPNLSSPCFFPACSPGSKSTLCPSPGPLAKADDQNSCACARSRGSAPSPSAKAPLSPPPIQQSGLGHSRRRCLG